MGKRGPPPAPTDIKIARGTHRRDRHGNPALEPHGDRLEAVPPPPESLGEIGAAKWQEMAATLISLGLLESQYVDALEMYCADWEEMRECEQVLKEQGAYFIAESGYQGLHPAVNQRAKIKDRIRRFHQEFGLTPSAATSVQKSEGKRQNVKSRSRA